MPSDDTPSNNRFEVTLRVLDNEFIGFKLTSNNFTSKWLGAGLLTVIILMGSVSIFGPGMVEFARDLNASVESVE